MTLHPKKMFLMDGLGALLSAFLLGFVLVRCEATFGMPQNILYFLSTIACVLAIYSLTHYFLKKEILKSSLKTIGYLNLLYCLLTLALILYFYRQLTGLGLIYFLGETGIITTLAILELRFSQQR